ncbi:MAG: hypothetical protein K9M44_00355 [Candidatus Pacebacteria bacterium]|nr:hypothetical protein [Candidatus Paceibacterota bacterium]
MQIKKEVKFLMFLFILFVLAIGIYLSQETLKKVKERQIDLEQIEFVAEGIDTGEPEQKLQDLGEQFEFKQIDERVINDYGVTIEVYASADLFENTTISKAYKVIINNSSDQDHTIALDLSLQDSVNNTGGCPGDCIEYYYKNKKYFTLSAKENKEIIAKMPEEKIKDINDNNFALISFLVDFVLFTENEDLPVWEQIYITLLDNFGNKENWKSWYNPFSKPFLKLLSPTGGESFNLGRDTKIPVSWKTENLNREEAVNLVLLGDNNKIFAESLIISKENFYEWPVISKIPIYEIPGNYKIKIQICKVLDPIKGLCGDVVSEDVGEDFSIGIQNYFLRNK